MERRYYGFSRDLEPNGFLVDAGLRKVDAAVPEPDIDQMLKAAGLLQDTCIVWGSQRGPMRQPVSRS